MMMSNHFLATAITVMCFLAHFTEGRANAKCKGILDGARKCENKLWRRTKFTCYRRGCSLKGTPQTPARPRSSSAGPSARGRVRESVQQQDSKRSRSAPPRRSTSYTTNPTVIPVGTTPPVRCGEISSPPPEIFRKGGNVYFTDKAFCAQFVRKGTLLKITKDQNKDGMVEVTDGEKLYSVDREDLLKTRKMSCKPCEGKGYLKKDKKCYRCLTCHEVGYFTVLANDFFKLNMKNFKGISPPQVDSRYANKEPENYNYPLMPVVTVGKADTSKLEKAKSTSSDLTKYVKMVKVRKMNRKTLLKMLKGPVFLGGNKKLLKEDPKCIDKIFFLVNESKLKNSRFFAENIALKQVNWTKSCSRAIDFMRSGKNVNERMVNLTISETAYKALMRLLNNKEVMDKELPSQ